MQASDGAGFQRLGNQIGRRDQCDRATAGRTLAEAGIDLTFFTARQQAAELVLRAAAHGVAGHDVLAHHVFHEADRRVDLDLAGLDIGLVDHPAHAAEMIDMGVAVDHRDDRFARAIGVVQIQRRPGGFGHGQRIDDDQPVVTFDDGHVGQVEAAHLIQLGADLEQTGVGIELGQSPQARIDRFRRLVFGEEIIGIDVPDDFAGSVLDLTLEGCDQAFADGFEIGAVAERQGLQDGSVACGGLHARRNRTVSSEQRLAQASGDQAGQQAARAQDETGHGCLRFFIVMAEQPAAYGASRSWR